MSNDMADGSNTARKHPEGRPFERGAGKDPRINRKGRPKSFDQLRSLAQQIAHEVAKAGGEPVIIDGHSVTVAEAIMRQWAQSKNPALQAKFVEVAFGRVPDVHELTVNDLTIRVVYENEDGGAAGSDGETPDATPGTATDSA